MHIPHAYREHDPTITASDRGTADLYLSHTTIGDPPADAAIQALALLGPERAAAVLQSTIDHQSAITANTPPAVTALIRSLPRRPATPLDPTDLNAAYRAFHRQSDLFISAFVSATLRNASTLIARSFHATGRVTSNQALARIRHNTHHLYEIMLPGSLHRDGDGWKLSLRIRLVHAQIRYLLRQSGRWDEATYGVPLSAAHLALASANFSATILRDAASIGAILTPAARRGYMQIWRFASTVIGVPDQLLFHGDEIQTLRFSAIAHRCEPPPDERSTVIAHALINALPDMAGETSPAARTRMIDKAFKVSRALLGTDLADALGFPRSRSFGVLAAMRMKHLTQTALHAFHPRRGDAWQARQTAFLLENAVLPKFDYAMPSIPNPAEDQPNDRYKT